MRGGWGGVGWGGWGGWVGGWDISGVGSHMRKLIESLSGNFSFVSDPCISAAEAIAIAHINTDN